MDGAPWMDGHPWMDGAWMDGHPWMDGVAGAPWLEVLFEFLKYKNNTFIRCESFCMTDT